MSMPYSAFIILPERNKVFCVRKAMRRLADEVRMLGKRIIGAGLGPMRPTSPHMMTSRTRGLPRTIDVQSLL